LAASACALLCLCSRLLSLYHDVTRSFSPLPSTRPRPRISPSSPQPRPLRLHNCPATVDLSFSSERIPRLITKQDPFLGHKSRTCPLQPPINVFPCHPLTTPRASALHPIACSIGNGLDPPPADLFFPLLSPFRRSAVPPILQQTYNVVKQTDKRIDRAHLAHVKHESAPSIFRFGSHTHWCSDGNLNGCQFITTQSYPAPGPVISFPVGLDPAGPRLLLFHVHSYCSRTRCLAIEFANCLRA
jgi:hypothetical protein